VPLADYSASDFAWLALGVFLILFGVGLFYFLFRFGETLGQVTKTVEHTETEVLPVINKAGGTLDRVNRELDKVDVMTDSAVDAVKAADTAVRTVSNVVTAPIQKLAGLAAGLRYGFSSFLSGRDFDAAMHAAREAAERREQDLAEDVAAAGRPPAS
jgi:uncharacterized protein YoxC